MADYRPVYGPDQLAGYDVVISHKPSRSRASLVNAPRLTAIRPIGYDNCWSSGQDREG